MQHATVLRNAVKVQRVSLETIAKAAGVHKATVSRSLRNHPTIPRETRDRIQQIAKELGYRPNPLVSMFQSQARASRPLYMQAALGWVNDYPNESCWRDFPWLRGYLSGARARCEEMGYRLEQVNFGLNEQSFEAEFERVSDYLRRSGIYGLVMPLVLNARLLQTRWENSVISVIGGAHLDVPEGADNFKIRIYPQNFPSADRDLYYNSRLAFQHLVQMGYHRIGLVYSRYLDDESHGRARSGFLLEQAALPSDDQVPILFLERFKEGRPEEFEKWLDAYRPEVILCVNPVVREWVEDLGLSVPDDIGLANLNIVDDVSEWGGICENHEVIGASAVDLIISALTRNEIGLPPEPRKVLVPGSWRQGNTLKYIV